MKKILSFIVMSLVAILPFTVDAATKISPSCGNADAEGNITCLVSSSIDDEMGVESLTITLTELGGADILSIDGTTATDWTLSSKNELNGVWTVILTSPGIQGDSDLFSFTYKSSGTADCKIRLALEGNNPVDITPTETPDEPTENKDTGATLPYIALGFVAIIAVGAYVATKNKAKMYRI